MSERHIVYAVAKIETDLGAIHVKRRVSQPLDWHTAQDRWYVLDDARRRREGVSLRRTPVAYLAVRAANDPDWPAHGRDRLRPRDAKSGRFV